MNSSFCLFLVISWRQISLIQRSLNEIKSYNYGFSVENAILNIYILFYIWNNQFNAVYNSVYSSAVCNFLQS